MDWGRPPSRIDVILDMRRLNRILAHEHGDLTATVEAGATLRDVNEALARHGQRLPLDPPFADARPSAALLATNDSGPLRHRYGTPRDLVIGMQLATTDGDAREGRRPGREERRRLRSVEADHRIVRQPRRDRQRDVQARRRCRRRRRRCGSACATPQRSPQVVRTVMASQLEPIAFEVACDAITQSREQTSSAGSAGSASSSSALRVAAGGGRRAGRAGDRRR